MFGYLLACPGTRNLSNSTYEILPKGEGVYGERIECGAWQVPAQHLVFHRIARILLFAGFTAVGAQLAVRLPFTPVPLTLQTLFVVMAGLTLGPRDGFYAMASYLGMGLLGAPVFAGFTFGPFLARP
jgi:hypothetical protein